MFVPFTPRPQRQEWYLQAAFPVADMPACSLAQTPQETSYTKNSLCLFEFCSLFSRNFAAFLSIVLFLNGRGNEVVKGRRRGQTTNQAVTLGSQNSNIYIYVDC